MAEVVPLLPLLASCALVAAEAGDIIRMVHGSRDLSVRNKNVDGDSSAPKDVEAMQSKDVVTVADTQAQSLIVNSLRERYPSVRIVGEEGDTADPETPLKLTEHLVQEWISGLPPGPALTAAAGLARPAASLCLWVDPLDGTKEFACGRVQSCCVLIGIAADGVPCGGVMYEPFRAAGESAMHVGLVGAGILLGINPVQPRPQPGLMLATSSHSRGKPSIDATIRSITAAHHDAQAVILEGCGNKILRMLEGTIDALFQGTSCCRWDTCAGEALLRCVGGILTDLEGAPYLYDPDGDPTNRSGVLAARTAALHADLLPHCVGRQRPC